MKFDEALSASDSLKDIFRRQALGKNWVRLSHSTDHDTGNSYIIIGSRQPLDSTAAQQIEGVVAQSLGRQPAAGDIVYQHSNPRFA